MIYIKVASHVNGTLAAAAQATMPALTIASWADPRMVERDRNAPWCASPMRRARCTFRGTALASGRVLRKGIVRPRFMPQGFSLLLTCLRGLPEV